MPNLSFRIGEVSSLRQAAVPTIRVCVHIANAVKEELIQSISLNCQVQLRPLGRSYSAEEEARLLDLFGEREQWTRTMYPLHWANVSVRVPPFQNETTADLLVPCSLDFDVAATKYFFGLKAGRIYVAVYFSGTAFYIGEHGSLQVAQISWDRESDFQLPVAIWKEAIDSHYPDSVWFRLPPNSFDRLYKYKVSRGMLTWAQAVDQLIEAADHSVHKDPLSAIAGDV